MAALVHSHISWDPFSNSDILDMARPRSQYPESDLRSIAYTKPATLSTSPLQVPSASCSSTHDALSPTFSVICCSYSTATPRFQELEPGVWTNGTRLVYSAEWPPVQEYLRQAKQNMQLGSPPSNLIFTLAALSVFYELSNPVHWMFWNDKNKDQTAAIVDRIALQQPPLIRSKVKWNGLKEYVWLLDLLHGAPSFPLFEHKEWYPLLGNHKPEMPQRSLRKRKPRTDREDPLATLDEEAAVEREPRPKRHKSSHNNTTSSASDPGKSSTSGSDELSPAATTFTIEDMCSLSPLSTLLDDITPEPLPVSSEEPPRNKRASNRKSRQARTPDASTLPIRDDSPDPSSSALLTPAITQSRDRSGSQSTLVNGRRSRARSASVLSAVTVVESLAQLDTFDEKNFKPDPGVIEPEVQAKEEVGMVTRRRATKAKANARATEEVRSTARARKKVVSD